MISILKIQLKHKYPKKIFILIILATITFASCSIYIGSSIIQGLSTNSTVQIFIQKTYLSYLSLTAIAGALGYFSYNGFIEDKSIFMSLIARNINIFYFIVGKIMVSLIYSIVPSIVAFLISKYYFSISIPSTMLIIINGYLLFYCVYFITYILNGEKNFDVVLAYLLILISFINALVNPLILNIVLLLSFILLIILLYFYANQFITMFIFNSSGFLVMKIRKICLNALKSGIRSIVRFISYFIDNFQFLAIFSRDMYSLVYFIPKLIIIDISFVITKDYKFVVMICCQLMVINFFWKILKDDKFIIKTKLVSSFKYIKSKLIITLIINCIIQLDFYCFYGFNIILFLLQNLVVISLIIIFMLYILNIKTSDYLHLM